MAIQVIKTNNGYQFFSKRGGKINPATFFINVEPQTNLTGTLAATATSTITGTGTAFDTELTVGDLIEIGTTSPIVAYVHTITSATSIVISDPTDIDTLLVVTVPALTTFKLFKAKWVGKTGPSGIQITTEESTVDTKSSDRGEMAENTFSTGIAPKIVVPLFEVDMETLKELFKGSLNVTKDSHGKILATSMGTRNGFSFLDNAIRCAVIDYAGGEASAISVAPEDRLDIFKVQFSVNIKSTKNSSDQQEIELSGMIYEDSSYQVNGKPQFWATNLDQMVFD